MNEKSSDVYNQFPEGSFARVVWDQQLAINMRKRKAHVNTGGIPFKILNLRRMSGCSYHALRTAGFVTLPSERTLRDYTNYIRAVPGLQAEVLKRQRLMIYLSRNATFVCYWIK